MLSSFPRHIYHYYYYWSHPTARLQQRQKRDKQKRRQEAVLGVELLFTLSYLSPLLGVRV